jgi:hypothetical protein
MEDYIAKVVRLSEILEQPPEENLGTRLSELTDIVDALRPEDFALLGRQLCHLLIDIASVKRIQFVEQTSPPVTQTAVTSTPQRKSPHRRHQKTSPAFGGGYPEFIPTVDK